MWILNFYCVSLQYSLICIKLLTTMTKITRLFDFPYYQLEKNNLPNCLVTKYDGQWISTSTQEYLDKSNAVSRALIRLGIQKNDKIAIISSTKVCKLYFGSHPNFVFDFVGSPINKSTS